MLCGVINCLSTMNPLQKYIWLINTIRRAGKISFKELSDRWARDKDLSDGNPLPRGSFNNWKDAIFEKFGIIIECQRPGGYLYYIDNPEVIDEDKLKKWLLDTVTVGNIIGENLSLKDRIIVDEIPSGREHLTTLLSAMKENTMVNVTFRSFIKQQDFTFPIEPYCVKLFENRWYVIARNVNYGDIRCYGLDRIEAVEKLEQTFKLPDNFSAVDYFGDFYGIVTDHEMESVDIVIRAYDDHKHYLNSLSLHHTQKLIKDYGEYADFALNLVPTFDFVMKLLQAGPRLEVISPESLRHEMTNCISEMSDLYK